MRIAYVAGFFKHVLPELQKSLPAELERGTVVWIPPFGNTYELNLNRLKGDLLAAVSRGADEILICLFYMRKQTHMLDNVNIIVDRARAKSQTLIVHVKIYDSARDHAGVIAEITNFRPNMDTVVPINLDGIDAWIIEHCKERVMLHPRASHAAKDSEYEDVPLVYEAIAFLANEYWSMRTSTPENAPTNRASYEAKLQSLGLKCSPAISPAKAKEQKDEYHVAYPIGTTQKRLLEDHLTKGADRDQRNCLRIYFFWDKDQEKVVIGWLTSHLETSSS